VTTSSTYSLAGRFIVLDGPDGCGKSTQVKLLAEYLGSQGVQIVSAVDPGGTRVGNQISRLLKYDADGPMDVHTEVMLFMASRAQLVSEVIRPALGVGKAVLCDRFISATCAYQGSNGYDVGRIIELGRFAVDTVWPDLTIVLDLPVEEGLQRTGRKRYQKTKVNHTDAGQSYLFENVVVDRFDSRPLEYHRKVRKEFLRLPDYYPGSVKVVDTSQCDVPTVHARIVEVIAAWAGARPTF
jgi:dTMP kinase